MKEVKKTVIYKPNSLIFYDQDVVIKTCNIYKPDLTEDRKQRHYLKWIQRKYDEYVTSPVNKSIDELSSKYGRYFYENSDFYVIKIKPEFLKELEKEEITFHYGSDYSSLRNLYFSTDIFDAVGDYILRSSDGRLATVTYYTGGLTQVWMIQNSHPFLRMIKSDWK